MKIGIDMGGTSIKIGLVDSKNHIVQKNSIRTNLTISPSALIKNMAIAVNDLLSKAKIQLDACDGIGIGSPGTIDEDNGIILYSNNFFWENVAIVEELNKYLSTTIKICNDADAAALGEVCAGAAKGDSSAILLTLGTGVGTGIIINQKIFHGPLKGGTEYGHTIIQMNGEPCTCGLKGCFEAYASATALVRIAKSHAQKHPDSLMHELCHHDLTQMNGKIPFDAAHEGDTAAMEAVKEYEGYLAVGIAGLINTFRPQKVILGGGVAAQKETLTKPIQSMVNQMCFGGSHGEISTIVVSTLGNDAGIIGAANLI